VVGWHEAFDELYKTRLLEPGDQDKSDYRALQPFG
jgi:hypothetical protein